MNFLSHFYFDRHNSNSYCITGTVLPDLVKNANKDWNCYPQKHEELFIGEGKQLELLKGWKRHLKVDQLFHSSVFFQDETQKLKQWLIPFLEGSPVRPSFLAHIGLELMLDHLLVEQRLIDIHHFYHHLSSSKGQQLDLFLSKCNINDLPKFNHFYDNFLSSRYLLSYQKIDNISYALQRICMRLWKDPFDKENLSELTGQLLHYKKDLETNFMSIFDTIEKELN
ncbi:ACP phosphodiesterase [Pedobacter montanisoli]|uniref:ACP phosphodiesterase n=1 Tax=Pedobacter montanisoli TaxID=2923277 RepID=A0ABS9ZW04_9SPHI|nr:ACP phosphodiesterase [Pedobacter montanisoli]MCJ0742482.1 ACP phosphodiesterase [Pedobacter montanisoli]